MPIIYLFCLCFTIIFLLWYVSTRENHSIHQDMMVMIVILANCGYLAMSLANNLEEAILANKIIYLSGCFMPMLGFLILCEICKIQIKKWCIVIMYMIQIVMYGFICTIGYSEIYYKSVSYTMTNHGGVLTKTYGPVHNVYIVIMFSYLLAALLVCIVSLFRDTVVSYKTAWITMMGFGVTIGGYILERVMDFPFEIVPLCYLFVTSVVLFSWHRNSAYSISENIKKVYEKNEEKGFVTFNNNLGFMGCNHYAEKIFPSLTKCSLDKPLKERDDLFSYHIMPLLYQFKEGTNQKVTTVRIGLASYDVSVSDILRDNNGHAGYMIEFTDVTERRKYQDLIEQYNKNLESEVRGKTQKIREIQEKTLLGIAQMVESRDLSTGGHIKRTSSVVKIFSRELQKCDSSMDPEFLQMVSRSAPMHDLGKIAVDDQILRKQGKYTEEEYEQMKKHSAAGAEIVRKILTGIEDDRFVSIAANVANYHHEKVDGTGYPEHLKGEEIPLEARIMALADVFDALVSKRCYKEAFSFDQAFEIIAESAGKHFDAYLADIFIQCRPRLESFYRSLEE